jgi:ribosome-binding protein aMBF1 (putative translation factor)
MEPQIITTPDGAEMVVIPRAEFDALVKVAEDKMDVADAREIMARVDAGEEEVFPAKVVKLILAGQNPIKIYRKYRGMTQAELADAVKTGVPYISNLETGARMPGPSILRRLGAVLKVDPEDLGDASLSAEREPQ